MTLCTVLGPILGRWRRPRLPNRRGAVALIAAVSFAFLGGFCGYAIDSSRVWLVKTRLKTSLDAAVLVAARQLADPQRDPQAAATFWANYGNPAYLGATVDNPVITPVGTDQVRVTASASVPSTLLLNMLGSGVVAFTDSSVARRSAMGMELSIVLDQTGSMSAAAAGGGTKIDAAKAAVRTMLGILYGDQDTRPNFWVSVVPFARTINIGTQNDGWLDTGGLSIAPANGWSSARWSGCVEARQGGHDITEASPATMRFRPYFWADTYRQMGVATGNHGANGASCTSSQAYPKEGPDNTRYCMGDNDWTATPAVLASNPHYVSMGGRAPANAGAPGVSYFGPNALCALNPIQPLTASRAAILQGVDAITAPGRSGGTTLVTGMQGGWFTLSPEWQGFWPNPGGAGGPALPMPYNTRNMRKAVVLLSDGDNNWQGSTAVAPSLQGTEMFYNAYGRLVDRRLPGMSVATGGSANSNYNTNTVRADAALDTRFSAVCAAMKQRGIIVYVVGFEVAQAAHRTLLQNCATSPQHYYESPSTAELQSTFTQVANQLSALRLTE